MHFCHVGLSCSLGGGIICTLRAERGDSSSASVLALRCSRGWGGAATHGREAVFTVVFARRFGNRARCHFSYLSQTFGSMTASVACTRLGCATDRPHPGSERPFCPRRRHRVGRCWRSAACAGVCSGHLSGHLFRYLCRCLFWHLCWCLFRHLFRYLCRCLFWCLSRPFVPASVPAFVLVFVPATCLGHLSDYLSGHLFRSSVPASVPVFVPAACTDATDGGQEKHRRIAGGAQKISGFPDRGSRDLSDR